MTSRSNISHDVLIGSESLDSIIQDIQRVETAAKKLVKDLKHYSDAVNALQKHENKCVSDLLQSPLCSNSKIPAPALRVTVRVWSTSLNELDTECKKLSVNYSKTFTEPLKEYLHVMTAYHAALRKREHATQEHQRATLRWKKIERDGKYSVTTAKLNEMKLYLDETERTMVALNNCLAKDLALLFQKSADFFVPLMTALMRSQMFNYKASYNILNTSESKCDRVTPLTAQSLDAEMKALTNELESLSIVKGSESLD